MGAVKKKLETISIAPVVNVTAAKAATVAQTWRVISNEPEASADLKASASMFAYELQLIPEHGAAEKREYLVGKSAAFAAKVAPSA